MLPDWLLMGAVWIRVLWAFPAVLLSVGPVFGRGLPDSRFRRVLVILRAEVRPFYLPAMVVCMAEETAQGELTGWRVLVEILAVMAWWAFKGEDDDRWKRRRKRVQAKIAQVGAKLVVVPAPAGS